MLWETLNGPGIHLPYMEYLGQCSLPLLLNRIVEDDLRPSMTSYALALWKGDPLFEVCTGVLEQCFEAFPQRRADITQIHNRLVSVLLNQRPVQ